MCIFSHFFPVASEEHELNTSSKYHENNDFYWIRDDFHWTQWFRKLKELNESAKYHELKESCSYHELNEYWQVLQRVLQTSLFTYDVYVYICIFVPKEDHELNDFSKYHALNEYFQVLQREDSLSALSDRTVAVCVAVSSLNITNSIIIGQCCRVCCRLQCVLEHGQVVLQTCCRVRCRQSSWNSSRTRYFRPVVTNAYLELNITNSTSPPKITNSMSYVEKSLKRKTGWLKSPIFRCILAKREPCKKALFHT